MHRPTLLESGNLETCRERRILQYLRCYLTYFHSNPLLNDWKFVFGMIYQKKIPPKEQEDKRFLLSLCDTRLTIIVAKICNRRRHSVSCYSHTIVDLSFRKTVRYNLLLVRCISLHKNVDTTLKS